MCQGKQIHSMLKGPVSSAHNGVLGGWVRDGFGQVEGKLTLQAIVLLPVRLNICNQKVVIFIMISVRGGG